MGKFVIDAAMDLLLGEIAEGNKLVICEDLPASYSEANTAKGSGGKKLAEVSLTPGDGYGDFTIANGDVSGRKLTVAAQSGITVDVTGYANHVAILDTAGSRLLLADEMATTESGTAQAGGASTITLAAGESGTDDAYNGMTVEITGGTGSGQVRHITDYVGSTKVATVDAAWSANPDNTSTYKIYGQQMTAANTANVNAFDHEVRDPT